MNPELSHEELVSRTRAAIMQLQNMHRLEKGEVRRKNFIGSKFLSDPN